MSESTDTDGLLPKGREILLAHGEKRVLWFSNAALLELEDHYESFPALVQTLSTSRKFLRETVYILSVAFAPDRFPFQPLDFGETLSRLDSSQLQAYISAIIDVLIEATGMKATEEAPASGEAGASVSAGAVSTASPSSATSALVSSGSG